MTQDLKKGNWSDQALKILKERYLHRVGNSQETPEEMLWRVATNIAEADKEFGANDEQIRETAEKFYDIMISLKFLPNSPTLMNAGLDNGLQYSACYVLPVADSISDIFESVKQASIIHQSGGGTGFSFSRLRPKSYLVNKSKGVASGPVSFMKVFDAATEAIKQGGKRRGANMGILDVDHPDIEEFINCKLDGTITNFNISVALTDAFMKAFFDGTDYDLIARYGWPSPDGGKYEGGEIIGQKNARDIFTKIVDAAWRTGDPGLVFINRINSSSANPIPGLAWIEATNPCGEQPLPPYESCNLGSINLSKFLTVDNKIDWVELEKTINIAVHFLDNVISVNPYPLPEIDKAVKENRRIGLGVMGWADLLFKLSIPYNSQKALNLAEQIMSFIQTEGRLASSKLGFTRGQFPNQDNSIYRDEPLLRNSTVTTIAPTGSISIIADASSGIEPIFALAYRHVVKQPDGERILTFINPIFEKYLIDQDVVWSEKHQNELLTTGSIQHLEISEETRKVFVTAHEIDPEWHVRMQAAFQRNTDNGVSKTVNLPHNATVKDVMEVYLLAYSLGCLGVTVFRDGCKNTQVLNVGVNNNKEEKKQEVVKVEIPTPLNSVKIRPNNVRGVTYRKNTPVGTAFITVNDIDAHGEPFEVFINVGKAGSDVSADAEGLGRLISLILRSPAKSSRENAFDIIDQLIGIGSGRSQGFGRYRIMSLADAVAQVLKEHINLDNSDSPLLTNLFENETDNMVYHRIGDLCPGCGQATLVMEEGCKKCHNCGHSEC